MELEITIQDILSVFPNTNVKKRLKEIKAAVVAALTPEDSLLTPYQDYSLYTSF